MEHNIPGRNHEDSASRNTQGSLRAGSDSNQVLLLLVLAVPSWCQHAGPWESSDSRELRLLLLLLLLGWGKLQEGLDCHCNLAQPFLF